MINDLINVSNCQNIWDYKDLIKINKINKEKIGDIKLSLLNQAF